MAPAIRVVRKFYCLLRLRVHRFVIRQPVACMLAEASLSYGIRDKCRAVQVLAD